MSFQQAYISKMIVVELVICLNYVVVKSVYFVVRLSDNDLAQIWHDELLKGHVSELFALQNKPVQHVQHSAAWLGMNSSRQHTVWSIR